MYVRNKTNRTDNADPNYRYIFLASQAVSAPDWSYSYSAIYYLRVCLFVNVTAHAQSHVVAKVTVVGKVYSYCELNHEKSGD